MPRTLRFLAAFILALVTATGADAACAASSTRVGLKTAIVANPSSGHRITGTFEVVDACTIKIGDLSIDPQGPAVYLWSVKSLDRADLVNGQRISDVQIDGSGSYSFPLHSDVSIDSLAFVILWCEEFKANFGGANFAMPTTPAPAGATSIDVNTYTRCATLSAGRLNILYTTLNNATTSIVFQASLPSSSGWVAIGLNNNQGSLSMLNSSGVTLVGYDVGGKPFALPYTLSARSQCDYSATATRGVCPDNSTASVTLLRAAKTSDNIVTIEVQTPTSRLNLADPAAVLIWAIGPLAEDPVKPIVLKHTLHASDAIPPSYASTCASAVAAAPSAPGKVDGPILTLPFTRQTYNVTLGPNPNYPNPPAWGVSYYVNGNASPVLQAQRGVEMVFNVQAGEDHPLYITTSILGGSAENSTDKVFGPKAVAGGTFRWTPDATTPNVVYYQCAVHQKLGWKILVGNPSSGSMGLKSNVPAGMFLAIAVAGSLLALS